MPFLLTQDKKIAIAVVSIFLISFSVMAFFLKAGQEASLLDASTIHATETDSHQNQDSETKAEETSEIPYFNISSEGKFTLANDEFLEIIGMHKLDGESLYDFVHINDLTKLFSHQTRVIQDKEKIESVGPIRLINGNNELMVLFTIIPIEQDDKVNELRFEVNDITAQVQEMADDEKLPTENNQKTLRKPDHNSSRLISAE
ncbi:PAS domain-containing protein [Patescibacteria group bacterium]|nr:PAS domain-containing protein [Patescibacteria group bacterium]